mgnify:CR=1 FL=1|tara:strand:- start:305 stop:610 length:306 start_codon:yes stop_codon:yes gene_type:complete
MIIYTTPTEKLNVSKLVLTAIGGQMFGLNFNIQGYGKYVDGDGNSVWSLDPIISSALNITGADWDNWDTGVDDELYVGNLALASLGLERAAAQATEESSDD